MFLYLSLSFCLSSFSVCLSAYLSFFVCLSAYLSIYLPVNHSLQSIYIHLSISFTFSLIFYISDSLSICFFFSLRISLFGMSYFLVAKRGSYFIHASVHHLYLNVSFYVSLTLSLFNVRGLNYRVVCEVEQLFYSYLCPS